MIEPLQKACKQSETELIWWCLIYWVLVWASICESSSSIDKNKGNGEFLRIGYFLVSGPTDFCYVLTLPSINFLYYFHILWQPSSARYENITCRTRTPNYRQYTFDLASPHFPSVWDHISLHIKKFIYILEVGKLHHFPLRDCISNPLHHWGHYADYNHPIGLIMYWKLEKFFH